MLYIQRIYDHEQDYQAYRVLVDRMWPRGISKINAKLDSWNKEIAPSPELRKWFGHDPEKFAKFRELYLKELAKNPAMPEFIATIKQKLNENNVTLLYGAKDTQHNQAVILKEFLNKELHQTN
ncbi:DUF488 domain-containing protein [Ligilactobacillus acidipiscis]|uniref:DUF488 domain-containing protein n=1 Tax=Ligilactobacillus acidipiscis TaxID=89059 RepID=A0A921K238_9LACO|nr:DUF488 domain-containing protein [Ligilactobacillus acidipiscis]WEV56675.1 DUF488 domain-containing protein [Ligilactobacillus acidipiscis]HJE98421.1 DUF488 domain-containing protein [Ligilactobacillus acidipiscis]